MLNLRGDQRTSGEESRREGGKLFGAGSRSPIAICVFVKNPQKSEWGVIHYHDIGDYLTRDEKLAKLKAFAEGESRVPWRRVEPDQYGDWINQRDPRFDAFVALGDKKNRGADTIFSMYSLGLASGRDAWCYNASRAELERNVRRSLDFYNSEVERYAQDGRIEVVNDFIEKNPKRFSWDDVQKKGVAEGRRLDVQRGAIRISMYRPFTKQCVYFHRSYNARVYQMPSIFPRADSENRVICVSGTGARSVSFIMVDLLPDLHLIDPAQCFPRHAYAENQEGGFDKVSNIKDSTVYAFQSAYPGRSDDIDANTVFDYIYGLLHSPDYREQFGKNLLKQLPRIPLVEVAEDFFALADAGKSLGDLHVNYEQADLFPASVNGKPFDQRSFSDEDLRVEKMRFGGKRGSDRSTIQYNHRITVSGIPEEAYDYSVNGRSPVEWVVDRQRVSTHKASGIVNDANRYAVETVGDTAYTLKLLLRAITVSVKTSRIIKQLPQLRLIDD